MSAVPVSTNHTDAIHDSQFDYYGQLLATCSSDRTIKIFSVGRSDGAYQLEANLIGHEGPVWMLAWAHPRFGQLLASVSYDNRTIIWANRAQRQQNGPQQHQWRPIHVINSSASVNGVAWAPHEFGLMLASANSDGTVAVTTCVNGIWGEPVKVGTSAAAHPMGAMSVSFLPAIGQGSPLILASAGCDGCVRLWLLAEGNWVSFDTLQDHTDWVRDVAFSPAQINSYIVLASCAQDRKVVIRRKKISDLLGSLSANSSGPWETSLTTLQSGVWRLSWSTCGTKLLATTANSEAVLLSQGVEFTEPWTLSNIDEVSN
eukprot:GDKJ01012781.1.p1 GENE.GDKJ01012781.1~~GDKJ01012781.1.p1  ORF type:complete len:316 (-),score=-2.61 GDKJ01012781.1:51-998(-)